MKTSEILALIGAGYTKAEIDAMENGEAKPAEKKAESSEKKPADPVKPEELKPAPAAENSEMLEAIKNLTAALQKSNARNVAQPAEAVGGVDIKKEVDGALLNLYNN